MEYTGLIDIHTHIIPRVDDGSKSMEQSMEMLRIAAEEGIRKIILTPHQKADRKCVTPEGIIRRMNLLKEQLKAERIPIELYPGNEIFYRLGLGEYLDAGRIRTLADSKYVLIEFYPEEDYAYIRNALNRVSSFGYWPIVAHVERYSHVTKSVDRLIQLKEDTGCLYQLNAASIMEETGLLAKGPCRSILKEGLADFVATDAHSSGNRAPRMQKCAAWLVKKIGKTGMEKLLIENPTAVLNGQLI